LDKKFGSVGINSGFDAKSSKTFSIWKVNNSNYPNNWYRKVNITQMHGKNFTSHPHFVQELKGSIILMCPQAVFLFSLIGLMGA